MHCYWHIAVQTSLVASSLQACRLVSFRHWFILTDVAIYGDRITVVGNFSDSRTAREDRLSKVRSDLPRRQRHAISKKDELPLRIRCCQLPSLPAVVARDFFLTLFFTST